MEIKTVGVVGCGLMGGGIAQVVAQSGYQVVVSEINEKFLTGGMARITGNLKRSVEKGKMTEPEMAAVLGRIKGTLDTGDFKVCDLVIEAVIEDMKEKHILFAKLDAVCPAHAILASNTSSLPITEMAAVTARAERFVGLHFFNPVPTMQLVEVIPTIGTSDETVAIAKAFAESLGKTAVLTKDTPAFIVNRLLIPYILDAIRVYESGVATKEDIDNAMRLGCNHPMGPLALADFVGLDTMYHIGNAMFEEFKEPRFAPPVLLRRMFAAKQFGRKSGKGFYDYAK